MRYGVVKVSTADLRRNPGHRSEMVSQGLLGAVVEIEDSAERGDWLRVRLRDGYRGWMRSWNMALVSKAQALHWRARARALVVAPSAEVLAGRRAGSRRVRDLTLGCRLAALRRHGAWVRVLLPEGERGWVAKRSLLMDGGSPAVGGAAIVRTARLFLGAPYLWGGVSPKGADCSGLVQTAFGVHGIPLPRDVVEQCKCGEWVRGALRPADLLFFGAVQGPLTHVGVWAGRRSFIHAGCPVEEASLDPGHPRYRPKLRAQYRLARRVVAGGTHT